MAKNIAREKITEKEILVVCQELGFDVSVIDSKAVYSKNLERYAKSKAAPVGFPDIVGNDRYGIAVYIELKAKGKLHTLRKEQYQFLSKKIDQGCFALVADTPDLVFYAYKRWRLGERKFLREYLEACRPDQDDHPES